MFPIASGANGRAAKRMNETTGLPASTIHRLLGLTGREKSEFNRQRIRRWFANCRKCQWWILG